MYIIPFPPNVPQQWEAKLFNKLESSFSEFDFLDGFICSIFFLMFRLSLYLTQRAVDISAPGLVEEYYFYLVDFLVGLFFSFYLILVI